MTDDNYMDRIERYNQANCGKKDYYAGRAEVKREVIKMIESCLEVDGSLIKLIEAIREL